MDMDEKKKIGTAIAEVLEERGGMWITANIEAASHYFTPKAFEDAMVKYRASTINLQSFKRRAFKGAKEIDIFFATLGFRIQKHRMLDVVPFKKGAASYTLPISSTTRKLLGTKKIYVLSVKK